MIRLALILFALLIATDAWGAAISSTGTGGDWTATGTWSGGVVPGIGDSATIAAGDTVTIDDHRIRVDNLTLAGASSQIECTSGNTLIIMDWTTSATTDFFASQFQGDDANTGAEEAQGATGPERSWLAAVAHAGSGNHVLFSKGGVFPIAGAASQALGGTFGSFGQGDDDRYGPRALWSLDATGSINQTGSTASTIYHTEIACGNVLHATHIDDDSRPSLVAPVAYQFKLDVDHTALPSTEPRLFDGTELGGGPDFILPTVYWTFGEPSLGDWDKGARATTTSGWSMNEEYPAPVATHVYETPGDYTATWKVVYDELEQTGTVDITIVDPDVEWPAADTWCFANTAGTFQGCDVLDTDSNGTCDVQASHCVVTSDFDAALQGGNCDIGTDNQTHRCLFATDDTFTIGTEVDLGAMNDDWMVGSFGSGARPAINTGSYTGDTFAFNDSIRGHIDGLDITGDNTSINAKAFFFDSGTTGECTGVEWDHLLISNLSVTDYGNGYNAAGNTTPGAMQYRPECMVENTVLYKFDVLNATDSSGGGVDVFMFANGGAILGSDIGNRQGDEHGMRVKHIQDFSIAHSDLGRVGDATDGPEGCGTIRSLVTIRNTISSGANFPNSDCTDLDVPQGCCTGSGTGTCYGYVEDQMAQYYDQRFTVHDNNMGTCDPNVFQLDIGPTNNGDDHSLWHSYFVWGNLLNPSERTTTGSFTHAQLAGADAMVANNAGWADTGSSTGSYRLFRIHNAKGNSNGETADTTNQRIHIYNNSIFIKSGNLSTTEYIAVEPTTTDTFIANNLAEDLDSSGSLVTDGENDIECNGVGTACNIELTANDAFSASITGTGPPSADWFKLNGTYSAGSELGVTPDSGGAYLDFFGNCREDSSPWEGFEEVGGTACMAAAATVTVFPPFLVTP